jgi:hypothetical protein
MAGVDAAAGNQLAGLHEIQGCIRRDSPHKVYSPWFIDALY